MASLADVVKGIQSTNELLVQNVKGQNRTAAMITAFVTGQQSSFGDKLEAGAEKGKSTKASARPTKGSGGPQGFRAGAMKGSGLSTLLGFGGRLISMLFTGIAGTALLGTIAGIAGTAFGAIGMTAILVTAVKLFGNKLLETIFDKIDPGKMIITDANKKSISDSLTDATVLGLLAWLISPKFAIATFFASIITDIAMSYLNPESKKLMKEEVIKGMKEKVGFTITYEGLFKFGVALAGLFGMSLITSAFGLALTGSAVGLAAAGGINSSRPIKNALAKAFRRGLGLRLGLAMMMPMLGEALGGKIAELTGKPELANIASDFLTPVLIAGMLGGPYAALVTAIGLLGVMAFKAIQDWVLKRQLAQLTKLQEARNIAQTLLDADPNNSILATNLKNADLAYTVEMQRTNRLGGLKSNALITAQTIKDNEKARGLSLGNKDFYSELTNSFYTGIGGTADQSPYKIGTLRFRKFAEAAQAAHRRRQKLASSQRKNEGRYEDASSEFSPGLSIARNRALGIRLDREKAEKQALLKAAKALEIAASFMLAMNQKSDGPGNHTVVVTGNKKVLTMDDLNLNSQLTRTRNYSPTDG